VIAVAGPHAQRPKRIRGRRGRAEDRPGSGARGAPEQRLEKIARLHRGGAVLRAAIVLRERDQDRTALGLAVGAVALHALKVGERTVEVGPGLLDLIVERAALRRLSAEQGEEAAAFATDPPPLRGQPVEFALELVGAVLVAFDLGGAPRVHRPAVDQGELALKPDAYRIAG